MRNILALRLGLGLILIVSVLGPLPQAVSAAFPLGFELIVENQFLSLLFNPETTEVAVCDQRSGVIWYSNPQEREHLETIARGTAKDALGAQLRISYFMPGDVRRSMNNYNDSIAYGQFQVEKLTNGVRVEYVLGKQWEQDDYFPVVLDLETYEEVVLPSLNRRDRALIRENYVHLHLVQAGPEGAVGSYLVDSPTENLRSRDQATFAQVLGEHISAQCSSVSHRRDVKDQHLEKFADQEFYLLRARKGDLLAWDREDLIALFQDMGFTPSDVGAIYEKFGLDSLEPNRFTFTLAIEYRLEGENFVVTVPSSDLVYPENLLNPNNQKVTYPLVAVDVLPYFGAAHSSETGYLFVPDGCGALIYLNNGKMDASPYGGLIYGSDVGLAAPSSSSVRSQQNYLPVFGIKTEDRALLGIIEEGDPIAQVNGDISGRQISYNVVYSQFKTMAQTSAQLQGEMPEKVHGQASQWVNTSQRMINVYQRELFPGDLKIRYAFLAGDAADYVGMARYYREYLKKQGLATPGQTGAGLPLFIELVGAVDDVRPVLGIPLPTIEPLTTFDQVQNLVKEFINRGISQLKLTYSGWLSRGVNHLVPLRVRLENSLGTAQEFKALLDFLRENEVDFYPAVDFMLVHHGRLGEFSGRSDAGRFLNRGQAEVERENMFSPLGFEAVHNTSWVLSPRLLPGMLEGFVRDLSGYGIERIAPQDLGYLLGSDFRQGKEIYRHQARDIVTQQLEKLVNVDALGVQLSGGNAYVLRYADSVVNLPLSSGRQDLIDEEVPFFPIVISGLVDYAGEPLNFAADHDLAVLKMVETGAAPYFLGFSRDSSFLKHTNFNYLYTGHAEVWLERAAALYQQLNCDLGGFRGQPIIGHEKLGDNVYQTVYPTGKVIVNYNCEPVEIDGCPVEARGYLVLGGGDL